MNSHIQFYSYAKYYDIAFDFKNVSKECQFINDVYFNLNGELAHSFLELGAGPALHALEMLKLGLSSSALDLSLEMQKYVLDQVGGAQNFNYHLEDMIAFNLKDKFDIVSILMDSTAYILTNDDMITHLDTVARHLNDDGIYLLEIAHPRSLFNEGESTINEWEMSRDNINVKIKWGSEEDKFDPITQVSETTVELNVRDNGQKIKLKEKSKQRCYSFNEFDALVKASGQFEILNVYGAMKLDTKFDNSEQSWRMIPVLKKKK